MTKRVVHIYIDDGVDDVGRAVARVANCVGSSRLTLDGKGKQRKSLIHCLFANGDGTQTVVKNFFRVMRNGTEEYVSEVLNAENTRKLLEISKEVGEILAKR